jgi:hypothetical protein
VVASVAQQVVLSLPLFLLIALGYATLRLARWPVEVSDGLARVVFTIAIPALLFRLMADRSGWPAADPLLLVAFFGGCLVVFVLGRLLGWAVFGLDGVGQSVFALGGIFSNNVMLGLPLAAAALGEAALPAVALVLVFNALVLWTLVTVSVEWARGVDRHGGLSWRAAATALRGVLTNPIVLSILAGTAFGLTGWTIPSVVDAPLAMLAAAAVPLALISLGMALAGYPVRAGWRLSVAITGLKLVVAPLAVWLLARAVGLPTLETQVVVLLASLAVGANVHLMARRFEVLEGPVAASVVLSTVLAALTTSVVLVLLGA